MCNHERLLDYLYDELPVFERTAFENHLQECAGCRTDLAELGRTRLALASWSPPESELGFRVVRNDAPPPRRAMWQFRPAWGLAAAAVLVLAVAAAISNIEVRYDNNGFVVRTGWAGGAVSGAPAAIPAEREAAVAAGAASEDWSGRLQQLDARLVQLEQSGARPISAATTTLPDEADPTTKRMSDAELLRAVRRIIAESETRQDRQLALRVTQMIRDFDATRAGDLARVEQGLRQIQGLTDAELIQHRNTLNHLLRVTQQR